MPDLIPLCRTDEILPGRAKFLQREGRGIAVFHRPDGFYAIDDTCPHAGAGLHQGDVEGHTVSCPLHLWQFCLKTGECESFPGPRVDVYPITITDGVLYTTLPPATA